MASKIYVNGPANLYTGTAAGPALEFLGFTEGDTRLSFDAAFEEVFTDQGGPRVPSDMLYLSEQAFISLTLVQYVEAVYAKVAARINGGTRGAIAANSIGTLMLQEGKTYQFVIDAPYQAKAAFSDMPACYNFLNAYLAQTTDLEVSTKVKKVRCLFHCLSKPGTDGSGTLYNNTRPTLTGLIG